MISPKEILSGPVVSTQVVEKRLLLTAVASGLLALSRLTSQAAPGVSSLPIKFAADQTNGAGGTSSVDSAAGLLNTVKWNNLSLLNGSASNLILDLNGNVVPSSAAVTWNSNNTWSSSGLGEENNTGTGENRDLMAGYLDTAGLGGVGVTINITGLPPSLTQFGYDVYVYIQGGVAARGGTYTLGANSPYHEGTGPFTDTFVEDTNPDLPPSPEIAGSNYLVFRNVAGNAFDLIGTPTNGNPARAPVNAIEIVGHIPEPSTLATLGSCGLLFLTRWRRRTQ